MTKTKLLNKYRAKRDELREELQELRYKTIHSTVQASMNATRQDRIRRELAIYNEFIADLETMQPIDTAATDEDFYWQGDKE